MPTPVTPGNIRLRDADPVLRLAFVLYHYFPHGGLQRDFLRISGEARRRGHEVVVYTTAWQGERPDGLDVRLLPRRGWSNHRRLRNFAEDVQAVLRDDGDWDAVVGFNKMPGLDLYYAADPCYVDTINSHRPTVYRLSWRYRSYAELERSVFSSQASTRILLIAEPERSKFQSWHATPAERFIALPPGISRDRMAGSDAARIREQTRAELGFGDDTLALLQVGSAFRTKGVDRSLQAIASLPEPMKSRVHLLIAGRGQSAPLEKLAKRLCLSSRVTFLGARDDVPQLLLAGDLLLHPARTENTGTVLLEAMAAGLPVLTTANCGYSTHVIAGQAGRVASMPFNQTQFNRLLLDMLSSSKLQEWGRSGLAYARTTDIYSMPERAVDAIETVAGERRR